MFPRLAAWRKGGPNSVAGGLHIGTTPHCGIRITIAFERYTSVSLLCPVMPNITRILPISHCLILLTISAWSGGSSLAHGQSAFVRGDGNADGGVNLGDAMFVLNALFTNGASEPTCLDAGDANDDGDLDASDAVYVLLHLFGGGPPPPPPGTPCGGSDPTTDDPLDCQDGGFSSTLKPTTELTAVFAPTPGVREPIPSSPQRALDVHCSEDPSDGDSDAGNQHTVRFEAGPHWPWLHFVC